MEYQYQSPWFVEALQKEDNLEVNQLDLNLNTLEGAWRTNLFVRPEKDWEKLKGRSVI